jgi:acyl carrier protein
VVTDIAAEIKDILVFHLGAEEGLLTDDARLVDDLGADRLDLVEIAMSCEERFDVDIPNHVAIGLATVCDAVRFVQAQVAATTAAGPARRPVRPRLELLVGEALQTCARLARRHSAGRDVLETTSSSGPPGARWRQGDGDARHPDAGRRRPGPLRPAAGRRRRGRRDDDFRQRHVQLPLRRPRPSDTMARRA